MKNKVSMLNTAGYVYTYMYMYIYIYIYTYIDPYRTHQMLPAASAAMPVAARHWTRSEHLRLPGCAPGAIDTLFFIMHFKKYSFTDPQL